MVCIEITKGIDIPIEGAPNVDSAEKLEVLAPAKEVALNVDPFVYTKFKLLKKAGDTCKIGEALAFDKQHPEVMFVAPAAGSIKEVRRGLKRRLLDIVIETDTTEKSIQHSAISIDTASKEQIIQRLCEGGAFPLIRQRPFDIPANHKQLPRSIFVNAATTEPFAPPPSLEVAGFEKEFAAGLKALTKLTEGSVHLVYKKGDETASFVGAEGVQQNQVVGPHPAGNVSVHIQEIDPVDSVDTVIWTLDVIGVITIGSLLEKGQYHTERVLSIAGPGILAEKRAFVKGRQGQPVGSLIAGRNEEGLSRMLSGGPLTGDAVEVDDYLHFFDTTFTVIPENVSREFLHFFRLGLDKYSIHRAYLSGHAKPGSKTYPFTTTQHGEHRGIVDGSVYDQVMPLSIPVLPLLRAIQGNDLELAEQLGLLEVAPQDFALPSFVCPSKTDMVTIVEKALHKMALENIH